MVLDCSKIHKAPARAPKHQLVLLGFDLRWTSLRIKKGHNLSHQNFIMCFEIWVKRNWFLKAVKKCKSTFSCSKAKAAFYKVAIKLISRWTCSKAIVLLKQSKMQSTSSCSKAPGRAFIIWKRDRKRRARFFDWFSWYQKELVDDKESSKMAKFSFDIILLRCLIDFFSIRFYHIVF